MNEGLAKKRRIRSGHKASATEMLGDVNRLLAEKHPDSRIKISLDEKLVLTTDTADLLPCRTGS